MSVAENPTHHARIDAFLTTAEAPPSRRQAWVPKLVVGLAVVGGLGIAGWRLNLPRPPAAAAVAPLTLDDLEREAERPASSGSPSAISNPNGVASAAPPAPKSVPAQSPPEATPTAAKSTPAAMDSLTRTAQKAKLHREHLLPPGFFKKPPAERTPFEVFGTISDQKAPWLALRAQPKRAGTLLARLPDGTRLQLEQAKGRWREVTVVSGAANGQRGFVYYRYVRPALTAR